MKMELRNKWQMLSALDQLLWNEQGTQSWAILEASESWIYKTDYWKANLRARNFVGLEVNVMRFFWILFEVTCTNDLSVDNANFKGWKMSEEV